MSDSKIKVFSSFDDLKKSGQFDNMIESLREMDVAVVDMSDSFKHEPNSNLPTPPKTHKKSM